VISQTRPTSELSSQVERGEKGFCSSSPKKLRPLQTLTTTRDEIVIITMFRLSFPLFLFAIALLVAQKSVVAQSSCSAAQTISSPFETSQGALPVTSNVDISEALQICSLFDTSSALGSGQWYSYTPSKDIILQIQLQEEENMFSFLIVRVQVFEGSCAALSCPSRLESRIVPDDTWLLDAKAGTRYYIYLFRAQRSSSGHPFSMSVNEIAPPPNDKIENAIALTQADLPYRGEFTTYGALSDFGLDACALFGDAYGVWFTYTSSVSQRLSLDAGTGNVNDVVGIQVQNGSSFTCIARGSTFGTTLEWNAERGLTYYILVTDPSLLVVNQFEFKLQSIGTLDEPNPTPFLPAPAPAPVFNPVLPPPAPTISEPVPTTTNDSPVSSTSNQGSSGGGGGKPGLAALVIIPVAAILGYFVYRKRKQQPDSSNIKEDSTQSKITTTNERLPHVKDQCRPSPAESNNEMPLVSAVLVESISSEDDAHNTTRAHGGALKTGRDMDIDEFSV